MKKNRKPQTLAERLADAAAAQVSGLAMFEEAAMRLDAATAAHEEIAAEIENEIVSLTMLAASAQANAERSKRAADKVRDLIA